jgi:hypothetical protein
MFGSFPVPFLLVGALLALFSRNDEAEPSGETV